MLYVAMSGAKQSMEQHASVANNMANISTTGFRAQVNSFQAVPVAGDEVATRAFVITTTPRADFRAGPLSETGRALDLAIRGDGWMVVQTDSGEAYTRAGNLQVDAEGQITTMAGLPIVGDSGPLVIPPGSAPTVAANGLITALNVGNSTTGVTEVGRLKLVNPPAGDLARGDDGLFRMSQGQPAADADPAVVVASGYLEGSNVNPVEAMVDMIATSRLLEMQMKGLHTSDENAQVANKLLAA